MTLSARSTGNRQIRLTDEPWSHIVEEHGELAFFRDELLITISQPDRIVLGKAGELIAIRQIEPEKWMVVIYFEDDEDCFVITAFVTRRRSWWQRRKQKWP